MHQDQFLAEACRKLGARPMITEAVVTAIVNRGRSYGGDIDRVRQHMLADLGDATPATDPEVIAWVLANHPG